MIRTILVGLDGSPHSEAATELGIRWARQRQALLVGLGVVDEPTICRAQPCGIGGSYYKRLSDKVLLDEARSRVEMFVEGFTRRCGEAGVRSRVLVDAGPPHRRILFHAEDLDVTLLGEQTYFHFETQASADRTLEQVLHRAHCPVVAVPERLPGDGPVVVATDGSPAAVRALQAFQASGLDDGRTVEVVSVARDKESASRRAEEGAKYLRFYGLLAEARPLVASAAPAGVLLDQVRERQAGMLVMGAYGRSRFSELVFGSTTQAVLKHSPVPVFLHP